MTQRDPHLVVDDPLASELQEALNPGVPPPAPGPGPLIWLDRLRQPLPDHQSELLLPAPAAIALERSGYVRLVEPPALGGRTYIARLAAGPWWYALDADAESPLD